MDNRCGERAAVPAELMLSRDRPRVPPLVLSHLPTFGADSPSTASLAVAGRADSTKLAISSTWCSTAFEPGRDTRRSSPATQPFRRLAGRMYQHEHLLFFADVISVVHCINHGDKSIITRFDLSRDFSSLHINSILMRYTLLRVMY